MRSSTTNNLDMEVSTNVWYEEKGIGEDGWYYSVFVAYRNGDETSGDEAPYAWGHADTRDEAVKHAFTATSALFNGE